MKTRRPGILLAAVAAATVLPGHFAAAQRGNDQPVVKDVVRSRWAARPKWSPDGQWIVYDDKDSSNDFRIYRIRPDGTGKECLTCDRKETPRNAGAANFDRSGRFLLFSAEKSKHFPVLGKQIVGPGAGTFNDVFVMESQTRAIYRLTNVASGIRAGGSLYPKFSHDGSRIAWCDLQGKGEARNRFGQWRIAVAPFLASPQPQLGKIQYYNSAEQGLSFCEMQAWTNDDSGLIFAGAPLPGQDGYTSDVCRLDLSTGRITRLTETSGLNGEPAEFEEHAAISSADRLAYMSSKPHGVDFNSNFLLWLKSDLWIANADGSEARQVTFYNVPGHPEYDGRRVMVSEMGWSPDGRQLVARVFFVASGAAEKSRRQPLGRWRRNPQGQQQETTAEDEGVSVIRIFQFSR
ncbi:MAG: TolB family protein [Bryobacteraceae bacterium]